MSSGGVVLFAFGKYFQKTVIYNFQGFFPVMVIPQTHTHGKAIKLPVEFLLTLPVAFQACNK